MKIFWMFALLLLALTACQSSDPNVLRAEAASIERGQARQTAEARANQVKATQEAGAVELATAGAAEIEISILYAGIDATQAALVAEQDRLDLALSGKQATQEAWAYSLHVTQTMAGLQASQTARPTVIAAGMIKAAANARTADIVANTAPFIGLIVIIALLAVTIILVWYLARRADLSIQNRQMAIEVIDRHNGAVTVSSVGAMIFRHDAEVIDRAPWKPIKITDVTPTAPIIFEEPEPQRLVGDPLKAEAIRLTAEIITDYGDDYRSVVGWRNLEGWTSSRWQKARGYLDALDLIQKNGETWEFVTGARDVLARLNSPTPGASV